MDKLGRIQTVKKEFPVEIVERRRERRVVVVLPVRLRLRDVDVAYYGASANLSMGGVYVCTPCILAMETSVDIELWPAGSLMPLQLRGTVVRHGVETEEPGMGLAFDWLSEEAGAFLHRLVEELGR